MKKIIIGSLLLITISSGGLLLLDANSSKQNKVVFGTTKNVMSKSNLPIDIEYTSQRVDVDEISQVEIVISTSLEEGELNVKVTDLEDSLDGLDKDEFTYTLTKGENRFTLNYDVSSKRLGIHYINLMLMVKGKGAKVLAVPVYIGDVDAIEKKVQSPITNTQGVPLSISPAEEIKK